MRNFLLGSAFSLLLLAAAGLAFLPSADGTQAASSDTYRQLNLFGDIFERVRNDYVEPADDAELVEAAINGMLASLDPHSSYLNPKKFREMQVQTRGEFGGLGIEVTMENGLVKVVTPIDETPAARAGVKAGDLITHLDGTPVLGMTLGEAVEQMRGPVNSKIKVTVQRDGEDQPLDIEIIRDIIKVQSVRSRVEGDIGYVRITTFNEQTEEGLKTAVAKVKDEIGADRIKGYVLDLRNNPGGLLDQAIAVADGFMDQGEIVSTRGRDEANQQRYNARDGDLTDGKPVVVLINGGSASASEIVAGALQDHHRAIVLGTKSFGKGSVQTIIPIQGQGALRMTTARYFTPSGHSIQAKGIVPDIEVPQAKIELLEQRSRTTEADLRNRLAPEEAEKPKDGEAAEEVAPQAAKPEGSDEDFQLIRALDLLRGLSLFHANAASR
ncbi:MAG: S41 family peptidase [Sneathiellaceae bacterium]